MDARDVLRPFRSEHIGESGSRVCFVDDQGSAGSTTQPRSQVRLRNPRSPPPRPPIPRADGQRPPATHPRWSRTGRRPRSQTASRKRLRGRSQQRVTTRSHEFGFEASAPADKETAVVRSRCTRAVRRREGGLEVTAVPPAAKTTCMAKGPLSAPEGLGRAASSQRAVGHRVLDERRP